MDLDFEKEIVLENERVLIRPLVHDDIDRLLQVATEDKDLNRFSPIQIYSFKLLSQYIENALRDRGSGLRYPFTIFDKKFSAYAGSTSFLNISNRDQRLEIGATWIGGQFQRTGLNRNCKFLLLSYAFDRLGFERVELKTDERNVKSRAAIEAIGGQQEGILRSHTLMSDGFRRNTVYYGILSAEWPDLKRKLGISL
jgi:RimJ/RimL family protein N-acetyltransferase